MLLKIPNFFTTEIIFLLVSYIIDAYDILYSIACMKYIGCPLPLRDLHNYTILRLKEKKIKDKKLSFNLLTFITYYSYF